MNASPNAVLLCYTVLVVQLSTSSLARVIERACLLRCVAVRSEGMRAHAVHASAIAFAEGLRTVREAKKKGLENTRDKRLERKAS